MRRLSAIFVACLTLAACSGSDVEPTTTTSTTPDTTTTTTTADFAQPMSMGSPEFQPGSEVPVKFTCDGDNVNPTLEIVDLPDSTTHLTIIVDDPDAPLGTWVHWLEYDIPVDDESYTIEENSGPIGVRGVNSWNLLGYGGPCPPPGEEHRYFFKIHALDGPLDLPEGADVETVNEAMVDRQIADVELMGTFGR